MAQSRTVARTVTRSGKPTDHVDELLAAWRRELPEAARLEVELAKRLSVLGERLRRAVEAELAELGVSGPDFDVLAALRRAGKPYRLKPSVLSRSLLFTSGGISNILLRLESAGLVKRMADPEDARSRWVQLTAEGVRQAERAVLAATRAQAETLDSVDEKAMRKAADALREVLLATEQRHG